MLCWRSRVLSRETRASSPARLQLSSAHRSLGLSRETGVSSPARLRLSSAHRSSVGAPSPRVSVLTPMPHVDAGMTEA
jgi:hypothetical protein